MSLAGTAAVVLALVLDLLVAELPTRLHPVAWFGRLVARFDREWPRPTVVGAAVAVVLPLLAAVTAAGLVVLAARVTSSGAFVVAGLVLFTTTSLRMLLDVSREVVRESADDLASARENLRALAGRDSSGLSGEQVRSAAVESAAENLADGLVGPLLAFAAFAPFSLPMAAGASAWVKAVNTLDSMLGYRHKPVGGASARLDDYTMWIPARAAALLLALAALDLGALRTARTWADEPASPNSGWPMATLAAALDVRLEKPERYALNPDAALPTRSRAERGIRTVGVAGLLAYLLAGVIAWS